MGRSTAFRWQQQGVQSLAVAKAANPDIEDEIDDWLAPWPDSFTATNPMWKGPVPAPFTPEEWPLVLFAVLIEKARAKSEVVLVARIRSHAKNQWQAAAWLLERRNPQEFGRNQTIQHVGPEGGAVQVEAVSAEVVLAKIAELRRLRESK